MVILEKTKKNRASSKILLQILLGVRLILLDNSDVFFVSREASTRAMFTRTKVYC